MCRRLFASAEKSTNRLRPAERQSSSRSQLLASATVYRDAKCRRPDSSNQPGRQLLVTGREISNINEPLTQNQQQELRVNTGEDFLSSAAGPTKTSSTQPLQREQLHLFN
jgi:hypothetical protein